MGENCESIHRIKEAVKYQKMAVHALFPEGVDAHLQVIEQEFHQMAKELLLEAVKCTAASHMGNGDGKDTSADSGRQAEEARKKNTQHKKIQKVTID